MHRIPCSIVSPSATQTSQKFLCLLKMVISSASSYGVFKWSINFVPTLFPYASIRWMGLFSTVCLVRRLLLPLNGFWVEFRCWFSLPCPRVWITLSNALFCSQSSCNWFLSSLMREINSDVVVVACACWVAPSSL